MVDDAMSLVVELGAAINSDDRTYVDDPRAETACSPEHGLAVGLYHAAADGVSIPADLHARLTAWATPADDDRWSIPRRYCREALTNIPAAPTLESC